ncbi:MAG: respiratory nitrate reductase subunit gamma [Thermoprotei archaeon]
MAGGFELFVWGVYPYIALTVFVVGLVLRYDKDPWGWTSKSSEILEKRMLQVGSLLFHWGFLLVVAGHILGLIIPVGVYNSLGVTAEEYHTLAFYGGAASGLISILGLIVLLARRLITPRIRATSGVDDYFTLAILLVVMGMGLANTLGYTLLVGPYDYRFTVGVWVRSLFVLRPDVALMASAPISYQIHVVLGLLFFAVLPFTRLVHIFSLPLPYLWRRYIIYRTVEVRSSATRGSGPQAARSETVGVARVAPDTGRTGEASSTSDNKQADSLSGRTGGRTSDGE